MKNIKTILLLIILTLTGLVICCSCSGDKRSGAALPEMKMPYIALNIALETQIIITNDREYLEELEKESGMNRKTIKKLFKYLQKNQTIENVKKSASNEIGRSIEEFNDLPDDKKLNFFVINILAPYLTMVVNNFDVNDANAKDIQSIFASLFNVSSNEMNPLLQLVEGSSRYYQGGVFKSSYTYTLNDYLKKEGFCLDYTLRGAHANIFKVEYMICEDKEWKPDEKISILVLKRIYPNFLGTKLGYAPAEHSDVFIIKDLHYNLAKGYKTELKKKTPRIPYSAQSYQKMWNAIGLDIDIIRANKICYELTYKDLSGSSLLEIEKNLIIQTAIHEAKHRIDAIEMPDMKLNLDLEVSAHLTTAILGVYPFLGLKDVIEWTDGYFHDTGYIKLGHLLAELWTLADKALKENYTEETLRAELLKIYKNHTTIQGNVNFIDLEEFKRRMMPVILKKKLGD